MKHLALTTAALLASVAFSVPAQAAQYIFDFTSSGGDIGHVNVFVTGTTVTSATGVIDGNALTGLSSYAAADQQLFVAGPNHFTTGGLSFLDILGTSYNLTNYPDGLDHITNSIMDPAGTGTPTPFVITSFSISAVPEPATWAMMIAGFGMIGFAARRRHRQTVRVTYA